MGNKEFWNNHKEEINREWSKFRKKHKNIPKVKDKTKKDIALEWKVIKEKRKKDIPNLRTLLNQ